MAHIAVYTFKCANCDSEFTVTVKDPKKAKYFIENGMPCPLCLNLGVESTAKVIKKEVTDDLAKLRKANIEHSIQAQKMATIYAKEVPREPMVTLRSPDGKTPPLVLPKSIIDGLTEKSVEYLKQNRIL